MKISKDASLLSPSRVLARRAIQVGAGGALLVLVAFSAIIAKEARSAPVLASVRAVQSEPLMTVVPVNARSVVDAAAHDEPAVADIESIQADVESIQNDEPAPEMEAPAEPEALPQPAIDPLAADPNVRWFNGRPVKPVKIVTMVVTAYSPDSRSCGDSADGITATLHSVETNGFKLVAADPTVLAYGSMITVPGYDSDRVVPVLDCGGAIKGRRLDVLFPTHEAARKWGVRKVPVTVWGYVDGKPADNPRRER